MKLTETILLIGLGGVIAYLVFGRKEGSTNKSLGGGGGFGADLRSLEAVDVIEPQAPINVNVTTTTPVQPTRDVTQGGSSTDGAGTTTDPVEPSKDTTTAVSSESFVDPLPRQDNFGSERFVILDNTQFPISRSQAEADFDIDEM